LLEIFLTQKFCSDVCHPATSFVTSTRGHSRSALVSGHVQGEIFSDLGRDIAPFWLDIRK